MLTKLIRGALFGVVYLVLSQVVGIAYLLLAAALGWDVPGYHEPAEYEWWSWPIFIVWVAGFVVAVWWGASSVRSRSGRVPSGVP